jgi:hypothetical protein
MPKRSILIADDFPIAHRGLYKLLEDQPDWKVVGEAADGFDAFNKAVALNPDLMKDCPAQLTISATSRGGRFMRSVSALLFLEP